MTSLYELALEMLSGKGGGNPDPFGGLNPEDPAAPSPAPPPPPQIGSAPDPLYIPSKTAMGRFPTPPPSPSQETDPIVPQLTKLGGEVDRRYIPSNPKNGPVTGAFPQTGRAIIDPKEKPSNLGESPAASGNPINAPQAGGSPRMTMTPGEGVGGQIGAFPNQDEVAAPLSRPKPKYEPHPNPIIAAAEEGATNEFLNPKSDNQFDEQKLLNDYLLSLKESKDNEAKLTTMNEASLGNSRLAMFGEGLSESASKMGNLMGKPTGSTMSGFGKEAGTIEQNNVDEQRKIYEGVNPEMQLARSAQIAQMLEGIRSSKAKSAQGAAELAIPKAGSDKNNPKKFGVPGYTIGSDITPETKEIVKMREAVAARDSFVKKMNQYIPLMKKVGGYEVYGDEANRIDALASGLKADAGVLFDLGVLQLGDMARLDKIVPSSSSFKGSIYQGIKGLGSLTGNVVGDAKAVDSLMESPEQLIRDYNDKVDIKAAALGYTKNPTTPTPPPAGSTRQAPRSQAGQQAPSTGMVRVKQLFGENRVFDGSREDGNLLLKIKDKNGQPKYMEVGDGN